MCFIYYGVLPSPSSVSSFSSSLSSFLSWSKQIFWLSGRRKGGRGDFSPLVGGLCLPLRWLWTFVVLAYQDKKALSHGQPETCRLMKLKDVKGQQLLAYPYWMTSGPQHHSCEDGPVSGGQCGQWHVQLWSKERIGHAGHCLGLWMEWTVTCASRMCARVLCKVLCKVPCKGSVQA